MPLPDPYLPFTRKLAELRIPNFVSGSVAATFYGEPRVTNGVDIILFLKPEDVPLLEAAFPAGRFYGPPAESIGAELARPQRGHFNLVDQATGFKADIYLSGNDPLHVWALNRVRRVDLGGDELFLAPPEYVIVRKLQFHRDGQSRKHLRDVHRMLVGLGEDWNRSDLERLIGEQGLAGEWALARGYVEP
ncbi:MAG: hypothetical protein HY293_02925 [Planctomycetes bacterium]|nr:hypothetical protein [Planctomycetota bacterium]